MPFSTEAFLALFATYNEAIFPLQLFAYLLGVVAVIAAFRGRPAAMQQVPIILALFWFWTGLAFHLIYFSQINPAAYLFGSAYLLQGLLFLNASRHGLRFGFDTSPRSLLGALFILYAIFVYPLLNYRFSHGYPQMPMFGVAPCPTTIFTFGLLLWCQSKVPWHLIIIPLLWTLVGLTAALQLAIPEDYGLIVAGVLSTIVIMVHNHRLLQEEHPITT